ncbi:MAG: helix-turn-helix domain-containing protein [Clostridia bacterium]|nr:helix-turn-helix domain-containing protein [Clostridia bacterium]
MAFSSMLKQLREERHLSQKEIADYLGITRQAVASYELGKREPDYQILRKLADYFGVSIDYMLGRANCRELNAVTVGRNIELIRGDYTYKELSEDIRAKTGALIFPEMLELYAKGERMPFVGTIKILAKYAYVHDSFFYTHNTYETFKREQSLYKLEQEQSFQDKDGYDLASTMLKSLDDELEKWILNECNIKYIKLAKEIQESGLSVDVLKPLIASIKSSKNDY